MPPLGLFGPPDIKKLKAKRDVRGLIKALGYPKEPGVRSSAAQALGEIREAEAVEPLVIALNDSDEWVRGRAAQALGVIGNKQAVQPLIDALSDSKWRGAWESAPAVALGQIGDARAVEPLIAFLKDSERGGGPRASVAEALGNIGDTRAVEPLLAVLRDSDRVDMRTSAAEALGRLGWKPGSDETSTTYWSFRLNYGSSLAIRTAAAEALGQIGNSQAAEALIEAMRDQTENGKKARYAVEQALDKSGWKPGKDKASAQYWIAKRRWDECARLGPVAVESLIPCLQNADGQMHRPAAEALGKIGDARAVGPLIAALSETLPLETVVQALAKIGGDQALAFMKRFECTVCGDYRGRTWIKEIKYTCPFCEANAVVNENDIPKGGGVNVACHSCGKLLHLPAQIWCSKCQKGLEDPEKILQFIAEENHIDVELLKREGKSSEISVNQDELSQLIAEGERLKSTNKKGSWTAAEYGSWIEASNRWTTKCLTFIEKRRGSQALFDRFLSASENIEQATDILKELTGS